MVFEDRRDCGWLRLLRPGFRHCFCAIGASGGGAWVLCDPLKTRIELTPLAGYDEAELADRLCTAGRTVLRGSVFPALHAGRFRAAPLTCAAIVARTVNLDVRGFLTPFQLFRRLRIGQACGARFVLHQRRQDALDVVGK